jgi:adenosine deaminase
LLVLISDLLKDSAREGATRVRLRYNPLGWVRRGADATAQVTALRRAADIAAGHGIALDCYVTLKREWPVAAWRDAVDFALSGVESVVRGVDVSRSYDVSDPTSRPPAAGLLSAEVVDVARGAAARGLAVAAHLGWHDTVADVPAVLDMGASRIGHGVPLADHPSWDVPLARAGMVIELCPSALARRTGRRLADMPVERWCAAGIRVEVGTDHPVALGTGLAAERRQLRETFPGWDPARADSPTRTAQAR